jgi:hypothetical protein
MAPSLYAELHQSLEKITEWLEQELKDQGWNTEYIQTLFDTLKNIKFQARQYRIWDISVPDVAAVLINSYCISWYYDCSFLWILLFMCFLGILVHRVLGIRTKSDRWLFPDEPQ